MPTDFGMRLPKGKDPFDRAIILEDQRPRSKQIDLRVLFQKLDLHRKSLRETNVILIHACDVLARRKINGLIQAGAMPFSIPVHEHSYSLISGFAQNRRCLIR
jgi:hypothetical protein